MPKKEDKVQVTGGASTFENKYASGSNIGGRVGYTKQLDEDSSITGGIAGYSAKAKFDTPDGIKKVNQSKITGLDLTYKKDDSSYGVNVRKEGSGNKVNITYTKSFAKGGMVMANCGASVPPTQKAKK
jgi:hypothetical protein